MVQKRIIVIIAIVVILVIMVIVVVTVTIAIRVFLWLIEHHVSLLWCSREQFLGKGVFCRQPPHVASEGYVKITYPLIVRAGNTAFFSELLKTDILV